MQTNQPTNQPTKMKLSSSGSGLWALLSFLWATSAVAQVENFVMDFSFSFFDDSVPTADPTEAQLSALLCETQVFLARGLQNYTGSEMITIKATDITSNRTNDTVSIQFGTDFNTADDSPGPSADDVLNALDPLTNPNLSITEYIMNYIYEASPLDSSANYFGDVNAMEFTGEFNSNRNTEGALAEATCVETMAPTEEGTFITPAVQSLFQNAHREMRIY